MAARREDARDGQPGLASGGPVREPGRPPTWLTSFVGRKVELRTAGELLRSTRLLTLTGAGGSGKTRLAAQLVSMHAHRFVDGARWVDLGPISDPAQVTAQVTSVTGVVTRPGRGMLRDLATQLAERSLLLCLDNCEQVLDGAAGLSAELLAGCPGVSVLATSREPLRLAGETVWTVPTLCVDDAFSLFGERGREVRPGFDADSSDAAAVRTMCARLDGLPLALELAAAWLRTLSARQIEAGLDDRFALLVRGPRGVVARHETLHASMSWSHDLLNRADQAVFRRLSVFAGGFTLDAASFLCSDLGGGPGGVLAAVGRLVDKSLVVAEPRGGEMRYRLLETVREYARGRLAEAEETAATRDRHLDYFLGLTEDAEPDLHADTDAWRLRLEAEHDNLREALEWGLAARDPERGRRLAAGLAWLWHLHAHSREGFAFLRRAIARDPDARSLLQARLLAAVAIVADTADPLDREFDAAQRALELAAEHDDRRLQSLCLQLAAIGQLYTDFDAAWRLNVEAQQVAQQAGDTLVSDGSRTLQGAILHLRDRHDEAEPLLQAAAEGLLARGDRHIAATTLVYEAASQAHTGRLCEALRTAERAVALAEPLGDYHRVGTARSMLALIQGLTGDLEGGAATLAPVLRLIEDSEDGVFVPWLALTVGRLHLWRGEPLQSLPWLERESQSTDRGRATFLAAQALPALGTALRHLGRAAEAAHELERAVELARRLTMPRILAEAFEQQASMAAPEDPERALELHHASLRIRLEHGLSTYYPDNLDRLGSLAAITKRPDRAARLLSASDQARAAIGYPRPTIDQPNHKRLLSDVRAALGAEQVDVEWAAGAQLPIDAALAYARRARGSRERPSTGWASLTPTEREVAELAASGATNRDIASRLFMSRGTVKTHLSHVYAKLGISNRTELAAHAQPRRT